MLFFYLLSPGHQDMWTNLLTTWWKMSRMGNASEQTTFSKVRLLYKSTSDCTWKHGLALLCELKISLEQQKSLYYSWDSEGGMAVVQTCAMRGGFCWVAALWGSLLRLGENRSGWTSRNHTRLSEPHKLLWLQRLGVCQKSWQEFSDKRTMCASLEDLVTNWPSC